MKKCISIYLYLLFLINLEKLKAKTLVKSISNDTKEIKIKLIGKMNLKFTPFFLGIKIPLRTMYITNNANTLALVI